MSIDPSTLSWWSLIPQHLDPVLFTLFGDKLFEFGGSASGAGFAVRWYGVGYLLAFWTVWVWMKRTMRVEKIDFPQEHFEQMFMWAIVGVLVGARLGYALFYNPAYFLSHPLQIVFPTSHGHFTGFAGMSFHGCVVGALVCTIGIARRRGIDWRKYYNLLCYSIPLGYTWGRLGNFMNGELYGRPTESAVGMLFPSDPQQTLRHPSQLYEAFGEGLLLFGALTLLRKVWPKSHILMGPLYVFGYGVVRFFIEFFREPDAHIGLGWMNMSRGQALCFAMMAGAVLWAVLELRRDRRLAAAKP